MKAPPAGSLSRLALPLREVRSVKRDEYFHLQRLTWTDGATSLVKVAASDYPVTEEVLLEREFELFGSLGSSALAPLAVGNFGSKLAAQYQDFDGQPLGYEMEQDHRFERLAAIVRGLCAILGALHDRGTGLVAFSPASFLYSMRTGEIRLADAPFAEPLQSVRRADKREWLHTAYGLYAAPEVVGHTPAVIDRRADLYTLGGVIYVLVCGRPPFSGDDPAEVVQAHLAREPAPLLEHKATLPPRLSAAILRLLSKSPSDRPSDAMDAERELLDAILPDRTSGPAAGNLRATVTPITFGDHLYGRDACLSALRKSLDDGASGPRLVFIEGAAGIGKTALVRELLAAGEPGTGGYFCQARFRPSGQTTPLDGWATALRDLAALILTKKTADHDAWRDRIRLDLGEMAQLIGALVPEWNAIFRVAAGPKGPEPDVSPERLAIAITRLLRSYAGGTARVTLFFDDLQWADQSSLRILELVLTAPDAANVLVIACVRKADAGRPDVASALRTQLGRQPETFTLDPLQREDVRLLVADSLRRPVFDIEGLVDVLLEKTGGNPFFLRQFLSLSVERGHLALDESQQAWRWDQADLRARPAAENVIEFLSGQIKELPAPLQEALRVAACLGPEFTLHEFCASSGLSSETAGTLLASAKRLLIPSVARAPVGSRSSVGPTPTYEFAHDRIFEACRAGLSAEDSAAIHLRIGRILIQSGASGAEQDVYKIARHMNAAEILIDEPDERLRAAALDLTAGRKARAQGAFSQALIFLRSGLTFLRPSGVPQEQDAVAAWSTQFELSWALHGAAAEMAMLNGQFDLMNRLCDDLLAHAKTPADRVLPYDIRLSGLKSEKKFSSAVDVALDLLEQFGVSFPARPTKLHIGLGFVTTRMRLIRTGISKLADMKSMASAEAKAVAQIIQTVYPAAYLGHPKLFPLLVYRHVNDSIKHGNEDYSAVTYSAFAAVLCALGRLDEGLQLANVGLELLQRYGAEKLKARVFSIYYFLIFPWTHHLRDAIPHYLAGIRSGLEHGDFEFASYLVSMQALARFHTSAALSELQVELARDLDSTTALGQERSIIMQKIVCQMVRDLRSQTLEPVCAGPDYVESEMLPRSSSSQPLDENLVFHNHLGKLIVNLHLGNHEAAQAAAEQGRRHLEGAFGAYLEPVFVFYESMSWLSAAASKPMSAGRARAVKRNHRRLLKWAARAPMNFQHMALLVEAELARLSGDATALEQFDAAIESARAAGYLHHVALAQERAASLCLARGIEGLARHYLRECYHSNERWGARAVSRRLQARYLQEFAVLGGSGNYSLPGRTSLPEPLDYRTLLTSSQAISGEILLPKLLERLLRAILEHAGAQRGVLILERRGNLFVEAEADVDKKGVDLVNEPLEDSERVALNMALYAARTERPLVVADARSAVPFRDDLYITQKRPRSVLCAPILYQGRLLGLIYLENNRMSGVFTESRLEMLTLLASQAAISIANARFHAVQIEAQQAKINPHFLFNALSSIADLAISDGRKAEEALVRLAHLYRYILANTAENVVPLAQELAIVESYLELEKLRYGPKLNFSIETSGDISRVMLPGLLLQPLVENSIRHGIGPKVGGGFVVVKANVAGDKCCLVVQDDGDPVKLPSAGARAPSGGTGFGLKSVQERLSLLYGSNYSFAISRASGYRVELEVPL